MRKRTWGWALIAVAAFGVALAMHSGAHSQPLALSAAATGAVELSDSRNGAAILSAENLGPGGSAAGEVTITNRGDLAGALELFPVDLIDTPGPAGATLSPALRLTVSDATGGGTLFAGALADLGRIPVGELGPGAARRFAISAQLPLDAAPDVAGAAASIGLSWTIAGSVPAARACAVRRTGTRRGNRIRGTRSGDHLVGLGGNDRLAGLAGDDCLEGRAGADHLAGGSGADRLRGGSGADNLNGGPGTDRFDAGAGPDVLKTRDGQREIVRCGAGRDRVVADRRDRLRGCERTRLT